MYALHMHINYYACIPAAVFAVLLPRVPLLSPVQVMMMVVNNHWLCLVRLWFGPLNGLQIACNAPHEVILGIFLQ